MRHPRLPTLPPSAPLLLYLLLALGLSAVSLHGSLARVGQAFPGFLVWDNGVLVSLHRASWTGSKLPLNGGVLTEVNGRAFTGGLALLDEAAAAPTGTPMQLRVRQGGEVSEHVVATMPLGLADFAATFASYLANAAALFLVGALALYLRPDEERARALALSTLTLGSLLVLAVDYVTAYRLIPLCRLAEAVAPASLVNLALVFPRARGSRGRRRLLVGALAVLGLGLQGAASLSFYDRPEFSRQVAVVLYVGVALALIALVGVATDTLLRARVAEERTRAATVLAGWLPAFAMAALGMLAFTLMGWTFSWTWVFLLLPVAPIATLLAIVRHDLLEAERVARLSAAYTLATASVVVVYAAGLALLDWAVVSGAATNPAATFAMILVVALLFDPLRRRIQALVDRAFYRSKLDAARELEQGGEELVALASEEAIQREVTQRLRAALAVEYAELRPPGAPRPEDALSHEVAFRGEPLALLACGPKRSGAPFSDAERDLLRGLGAQTALALHNARAVADLTEAERALRTHERLAAIGEFAGFVAHGMRNPLAGISAAAQAAEGATDAESARRSLNSVISETARLERRVRSLLRFSRPTEPQRRLTELCEVLARVEPAIRALAERSKVALSIEVPEEPLRCEVDPLLLQEALLELASNAVLAMPEGGSLALSLEARAGHAALRVADTGHGIPEELQPRAFDLFFTTRPEGTGLGLANVQKIAQANGGSVEIERSDESGSVFCLRFDLV